CDECRRLEPDPADQQRGRRHSPQMALEVCSPSFGWRHDDGRPDMRHTIQILGALAFALILSGCGGSGGTGGSKTGQLALKVKWPAKSRLIPGASKSIKAVVTAGSETLGTQTIGKPEGDTDAIVTFRDLPAGQ